MTTLEGQSDHCERFQHLEKARESIERIGKMIDKASPEMKKIIEEAEANSEEAKQQRAADKDLQDQVRSLDTK